MEMTVTIKLTELEERIAQARTLLAASANLRPWQRDGNISSRAKFVDSEIERLSAEAETEFLTELIESIEKEDDMSIIAEMRNRIKDKAGDIRSILLTAEKEKRGLTREESNRKAALYEEISAAEKRIADEQKLDAVLKSGDPSKVTIVREEPLPGYERAGTSSNSGGGRPSYRSLFGAASHGSEFRSMREFLSSISSGRFDPRLQRAVATGGSEGIGHDGGFAVPEEYASAIFDAILDRSIVLKHSDIWPMASNTLYVPIFGDADRSQSLRGFTGGFFNEAEQFTLSKPSVSRLTLIAKKLIAATALTRELLEDSPGFESKVTQALADCVAWTFDKECLVGTSANVLSVLQSPSLITVSKESGQTGAVLAYRNLAKMFARLAPEHEAGAIFVASPSTKPQLLELAIPLTGGDNQHVPVLREESGQWKCLGKPIYFSEHLPALGVRGDIVLANFGTGYAVGMKKQISVESSAHAYWASDEWAYRCVMRADAMSKLAQPITPSNGGDTLSWAVCLETR